MKTITNKDKFNSAVYIVKVKGYCFGSGINVCRTCVCCVPQPFLGDITIPVCIGILDDEKKLAYAEEYLENMDPIERLTLAMEFSDANV